MLKVGDKVKTLENWPHTIKVGIIVRINGAYIDVKFSENNKYFTGEYYPDELIKLEEPNDILKNLCIK